MEILSVEIVEFGVIMECGETEECRDWRDVKIVGMSALSVCGDSGMHGYCVFVECVGCGHCVDAQDCVVWRLRILRTGNCLRTCFRHQRYYHPPTTPYCPLLLTTTYHPP